MQIPRLLRLLANPLGMTTLFSRAFLNNNGCVAGILPDDIARRKTQGRCQKQQAGNGDIPFAPCIGCFIDKNAVVNGHNLVNEVRDVR